ncbi:TPA: hypothetical protein RQK38_000513 [Vibrio vulnificus]|nr:hypothetical protein [Vibrio vulnificus]
MNKGKAKQIAKACRAMAIQIKQLKQSSETPSDIESFNAGGFVPVNKDSSSMLMQVLQQASEPPAETSEADAFKGGLSNKSNALNQDYDPRDEQTQSQLSGRLMYWYEDPDATFQKRIDKEKVERQMQQVRSEMIGQFK